MIETTGLERLYQRIIKFISFALLLFLSYRSITQTYSIDEYEREAYCTDSPLKNLFWCAIVLAVFVLCQWIVKKRGYNGFKAICNSKYFYYFSLIVLLIAALGWVLTSRLVQAADPLDCYNDAVNFHNGNFDSLQPGGYLNCCINQLGFVWFASLIVAVFDSQAILVVQVLNAIAAVVFYIYLAKIFTFLKFSESKKCFFEGMVFLVGVLFSPLIYLCSHFYGNVLGLSLATVSVYHEILFYAKPSAKNAVISILTITLALVIKMNYYIFATAMFIYGVVKGLSSIGIKRKILMAVVFPILIVIFSVFQYKAVIRFTEWKSGCDLSDSGYSYYSHIAMGLQHSEYANPGWWNRYNNLSYEESGYSTSKQEKIALESIADSLNSMRLDPVNAAKFFFTKVYTMWLDPEFQSDLYSVGRFDSDSLLKKISEAYGISLPWDEYGQSEFLDVFQSVVLIGATLSVFLSMKKNEESTILLMIFIGGFVFHLAWEAKAVFAIPYFTLLIPFAIDGYDTLAKILLPAERPM